ncbi:uncharacterized protein A1O5_05091 [Cladophialophora psammophila CBS 110553]|uniref:Peptidase S59 domain-containing protein n=1 Tax=Cladophialophora psammophila CBS 110553 TaxID=1182543 RepID=W9X1S6_9EURO|nr:uncharacterized protein A1O5_05091 [Cladophialophora psammophila CBS 110553]EXJ71285.1 hypothetical protein A1O5_05091 [Cladophialophora psammophila CBS 110553]
MSSGGDRRFVFGSTTSPQSSGFGGFGTSLQPTTQPPAQFGSSFTTTGPSLFGNVGGSTGGLASSSAGRFGASSTSGFGTPSTQGFGTSSTQGFGTPSTQGFGIPSTQGFGTPSTSGFGTASTSGFGTISTPLFKQDASGTPGTFGTPGAFGFGKALKAPTIPMSNGTAIPAFTPTVQRDDVGSNCRYQSISFMPPYSNFSFEELRLADYNAGRRYATPVTSLGGFGSNIFGGFGTGFGTGFAAPATTTSATSLFGTTGATSAGFASKPSLFGTPQSTASPFGTTSFSSSPSPFKGLTTTATTSGQGLFGSTATASAPGFGSSGAPQRVFQPFGSGMGGFGTSTTQNQPSVSAFGGVTTGGTGTPFQFPASSGTSLFGKSAFGGTQGTSAPSGGGIFGGVGTSASSLAPVGTAPSYSQQPWGGSFGTSPWGVSGESTTTAPGSFLPFVSQSTVQQPFGTTKLFGGLGGTSQISQPAAQPMPDFKVSSLNDPNPYGQSSLWTGLHLKPSDGFEPLFTPLAATEKMKESQSKQPAAKPPAKAFYMTPTRRAGLGVRPLGMTVESKAPRRHFAADGDTVLPFNSFDSSRRRWSSGDMQRLTIDPNIRQDLFRRQSLSPEPLSQVKPKAASVTSETDSGKEKPLTEQMGPREEIKSTGVSTEQRPYESKSENESEIGTGSDTSGTRAPKGEVEFISETGDRLLDIVTEDRAAGQSRGKKAASEPTPDLHPGEYWMKPNPDELRQMPADKLQRFTGFVVGRKGCGRVTFDGPVDLTALPMDNLYDEIIRIRPRSITVYPDESSKPPPGQGLNVPATLCIENSWPRAEGKPSAAAISGPHVETHINRLKEMKGTQFIGYEVPTGTWTFKVPHFTDYYDPDLVERNELL